MGSQVVQYFDDEGKLVGVHHTEWSPDPEAEKDRYTEQHRFNIMPANQDALQLCYALMSRCEIVDPEALLHAYPVNRVIEVAAYGLWKWRRREIKAPNPSSLILTVLRRKSAVPDVRAEILKEFAKPRSSTADQISEMADSKKLIDSYLKRDRRC